MLKHRLISGLGLVGFILTFVFWKHGLASGLFLVFGATLIVLAMREFFVIASGVGAPGYRRVTLVAALLLAGIPAVTAFSPDIRTFVGGDADTTVLFFNFMIMGIFLLACFATLFRSDDFEVGVRSFFSSVAGFFYVGWTMACLSRIYFWQYELEGDWSVLGPPGPYLFLYVVLVTKFGDIGGYTLGRLSSLRGRKNHKIIPRVSPGKSWEGLVGSVLFSIGIAVYLMFLFGEKLDPVTAAALTGWRNILVAVFLALLGLVSDLTESVLKRAGKVKDSGSSLPGLGGVLDAVDSLLLVAPIFYCYLVFTASA